MCEEIDRLLKKNKYKKFFVTEDQKYEAFLRKNILLILYFIIHFDLKNEAFKIYPRKIS